MPITARVLNYTNQQQLVKMIMNRSTTGSDDVPIAVTVVGFALINLLHRAPSKRFRFSGSSRRPNRVDYDSDDSSVSSGSQ